jgi:hypothetical protein
MLLLELITFSSQFIFKGNALNASKLLSFLELVGILYGETALSNISTFFSQWKSRLTVAVYVLS